jgi:hypothetical protein
MTDTTTTKPVEKPVDKAALKQKLSVKINEMFGKDDKADPIVVERVNQIVNDAVSSMPDTPKEPSAEKPKDALIRRLKEQVEAVKAGSDPKSELVKKIDQVVAAVEAAMSESAAAKPPVAPVTPAAPAAPTPHPKT